MEQFVLNGVGKKMRSIFLKGQVSESAIVAMFRKNKKEADSFSCFCYRQHEIERMAKETHNPLLKKKLEDILLVMQEKRQTSQNQNNLSLQKLEEIKVNGCGVGLRKVLKRMKKEAKNNMEAKLILLLLETEYANLSAKQYNGKIKKKIYERKTILLYQMTGYLEELGWKYGISYKTGKNASYIVYVYLPNGVQLSWHCNEYQMRYYYPDITCEWDGQVAMTMEKILSYIGDTYHIGEKEPSIIAA